MRFLLDENVEREVYHRLTDRGHDVVHVGTEGGPGKGATDAELAEMSRSERRVVVTYDDDFRDGFSTDEYHAVLFLPDQTRSAKTVSNALQEVSTYYSTEDVTGFVTLGRSWLE